MTAQEARDAIHSEVVSRSYNYEQVQLEIRDAVLKEKYSVSLPEYIEETAEKMLIREGFEISRIENNGAYKCKVSWIN